MLFGYPLALILRYALHPGHTSLIVRHMYTLLTGMGMCLLCYGLDSMFLLVFFIAVSYCLIHFISPQCTQRYVIIARCSCLAVHTHEAIICCLVLMCQRCDPGRWHNLNQEQGRVVFLSGHNNFIIN